jgi:NAD(P)-dependent dehydrogenase (short-subunit alcohol dehydrogenase family)
MEQRVAIVTGGLRGLGRAMAFGLAREGHSVLAIGHIDTDVAEIEAATAGANFAGRILPLVADLRRPADCDRLVAMAQERFGTPQILVNNAGLTFTTIDPARFRRAEPQKFWQVPDASCTPSSRPTTSPPTRWPAAWHPVWSKRAGAASSM